MNPPRVMIIDDNVTVRESLRVFLEDLDFPVRTAGSAAEAFELLARERSDVALVDLRLPGVDGESFILAAREAHPQLRFLIYTGSTAYALTRGLAQIGMTTDHVLRKPAADLNQIAEAIRRLAIPSEGKHG